MADKAAGSISMTKIGEDFDDLENNNQANVDDLESANAQDLTVDKAVAVSKSDRHSSSRAESSTMGARMFYFIVYGLFYLTLMIYKNPLRDIITFASSDEEGGVRSTISGWLWLVYYFGLHGIAIFYFLTTATNPGFVDDTWTESERKEREMGQV